MWSLSPTSILHSFSSVTHAKGLISHCYSMLLSNYLDGYPSKVRGKWEGDIGQLSGDQWEDALQGVVISSLISSQKLSQLYIVFRSHYTPARLQRIGALTDTLCCRCKHDRGDLIHLLWRCPKLHRYWTAVLDTLNRVFQTQEPLEPKCCLLGNLSDIILD